MSVSEMLELPGDVAREALDSVDNMLIVTDAGGHIVYVNEAFTRVTGYSYDEAVGATPALLQSGMQDRDFYADLWRTVLAGERWDGELVNRKRDGSLYTDRMTIIPLLDEDGAITNFMAVKRDVSSHLADLTAGSPLGTAHVDASGRLVYANERLETLLGLTFEDLLGSGWLRAFDDDARARVRAAVGGAAATRQDGAVTIAVSDDLVLRLHLAPLTVGTERAGVVVTVQDVTTEAAVEAALRAREEYARAILDSLDAPTAVVDADGIVTEVNGAWRRRAAGADAAPDEVGPGADYLAVCRRSAADGVAAATEVLDHLTDVLDNHTEVVTVEYACPEDETFWELRITPLRTPGGGAVLAHADITPRHELELVLRERVVTDELTGLQNRAGFGDLARRAMARAAREGSEVTVVFIDLDDFKAVNDEHGHDAGDQVLVASAARLLAAVRETDVVARLGGDEFAVVCEAGPERGRSIVAARIEAALAQPVVLHTGVEVAVGASVGTASGAAGDDLDDLVKRADTAMYEAKHLGQRAR